MTINFVPAAQYLRMSFEHQQYSIENQTAAIQKYAETMGFEIVRTYSDPARTGIVLRHRPGLQQLLQDVVNGTRDYNAILVYDISRWGRFQDVDESAHYEFLCKSSGVPVHYCAETFSNDGTFPSSIMKAMKRAMAGEYVRELGVKVIAGQKRLARLGFKQGGAPGYGLRRMLVSADRTPMQLLSSGQRKSLTIDRVILVPGPIEEVQRVKEIYRLLIEDKRTVYGIASELNRQRVPFVHDAGWDYPAVHMILTHPKYMGCHVFNRTSSRLYTRTVKQPKSEWVMTPGAFEPIVDQTTFEEAQRILRGRTFNKPDEELLELLKALRERNGRLSLKLVQNSPDMPSPSTYRKRFGSLTHAYELIGYGSPGDRGPVDLRRRTQALRQQLMEELTSIFPDEVTIIRKGGRWRARLRLSNGRHVAILVCRALRVWKSTIRWRVDPNRPERKLLALIARLDPENRAFQDFHVVPSVHRSSNFQIAFEDRWLKRGRQLPSLNKFCEIANAVYVKKRKTSTI